MDPSGHFSMVEIQMAMTTVSTLASMATPSAISAGIAVLPYLEAAGLSFALANTVHLAFDSEYRAERLSTPVGYFWTALDFAGATAAYSRLVSAMVPLMRLRMFAGANPETPAQLFRGTSVGFEGGPSIQAAGVTPTTSDPLVATLMATRSAEYGSGVVYVADSASIANIPRSSANVLSGIEKEVALVAKPAEFAARARAIPVAKAQAALRSMGINVPPRIYDTNVLNDALATTPRLSEQQIQEFLKLTAN